MIDIDKLVMKFGRARAVDGVSLRIGAGESVALWGANGAGKTTIIRCVLGLLRYDGRIGVGGLDARRRGKEARRLIGYVPQELGFYDELRAGEAVRFFGRLKGLRIPDAGAVLERVGLEGQARKRIRELSGGMKQRLALAIAMLGDPPVLILDEVTASLDACGREQFVALLARLAGSGRAMLFASHRIDEVATLAQRVVMLEQGRIAAECSAGGFVERLGFGSALHVHTDGDSARRAISLLKEHGFDPRMNGVGIIVPVPAAQKAAPLRILAEARIRFDDFDLLATPEIVRGKERAP